MVTPPPLAAQLDIFCVDDLDSAEDDGVEGVGDGRVEMADSPPWPKMLQYYNIVHLQNIISVS